MDQPRTCTRRDASRPGGFGRTSSSLPDQQGFVENDWIGHEIAIDEQVHPRVTGPCPRCVMTTLPQADLPKDVGTLRTGAQHNQVNVGVYAEVIAGGLIRRGDPVTFA